MKLSIFIFSLFVSIFANANDGSMPYLDVQGVNPYNSAENLKVDVYGEQTVQLFENLPIDFVYPEYSRSIFLKSKKWFAGIQCLKEYDRPTTGEIRDDHMCSFLIFPNENPSCEEGDCFGDSYNVAEGSETFAPMQNTDLKALGINPNGAAEGNMFSFYGKQTSFFADTLLKNGPLEMQSNSWKVSLSCAQTYNHPLTGEAKKDGICTANLKKK